MWDRLEDHHSQPIIIVLKPPKLARYWNCDGQPRFYHHTGAVSNYYGLREALSEYAEVPLGKSP